MHTFNQTLIHRIHHHTPIKFAETKHMAAVMILFCIDNKNEVSILLTKRTETLPTYAGHFSFPGGMRDTQDENLWETAKREVEEELNLFSHQYEFIGELDDFYDRYGNVVRPFVTLLLEKNRDLLQTFSREEVAAIHFFPLSKLAKFADDPTLHAITKRRPSFAFKEGDVFIWGLTASILMRLKAVLFGV